MIRKFPHLCSPIQIGNVTLRNRMACAPMGGTDITPEGAIGPKSTAFYEHRARGGASVVTVSEVVVHPETDASANYHLDEDTIGLLSSFTYTADAIRRNGAIPSMELSHGGVFGSIWSDASRCSPIKFGPSAVKQAGEPEVFELSTEQIKEIITAYGRVAGLAKRAGFEMVMIHGGHGWLINQFLSPYHNKRSDAYGGSFEKRCRFALETIESVRSSVGKEFPIEFRMSGFEAMVGGYGFDTGLEIAKTVAPFIDLLHVSAGSHHIGHTITHPSAFQPHACNAHMSAEIKRHVKIPVATVGGIGDPVKMEALIASGQADVLYMAHALVADPYFPIKVMENRDDEIIACLRCYTCNAERQATRTRRCAVNPVLGREIEGFEIETAAKCRKVLVAGGGPGGMKAALTAAQRGHRTILCEKTDRLGGIANCEEGVPFKEPMFNYSKTMERLLRKEGVEIRLNTTVTADYATKENVDVMICAIGSETLIPPLPGVDRENVIPIMKKHERRAEIGQRIAVLGGGIAGCEEALYLASCGKTVVLVEMQSSLAADANHFYRDIILEQLDKHSEVSIRVSCRGTRVCDEGLYCIDAGGVEELIVADTIILATGQRARKEEAGALIDAAPRVCQIGDCVSAKDITTAIYQGYHAALGI